MDRRIEPVDYVLGELEPAERAEAERLLREDPRFRAEVERMLPVVDRLAELPAPAWEGLQTAETAFESAPGRSARRWALRPALAIAASVLLLVAGGVGGALLFGDDEGEEIAGGNVIALEPVGFSTPDAKGTGEVSDQAGDDAVVRVSGLDPSGPGQYYELWLLSDPERLVSLGSFRVPESGRAEVRVPLPVDPRRFRFLDLSLERVDEGPEHSGISVLRGPLS